MDLEAHLGPAIEDPDEESFLLFAQPLPSADLGFVDRSSSLLSVDVAGHDFLVHQSPSLLTSTRSGGTTGAVLWRITPLLAAWLSHPPFPLLPPRSTVLELGCGISPLCAQAARPRPHHWLLTDQPYVARQVARNLAENVSLRRVSRTDPDTDIRFVPLDWESGPDAVAAAAAAAYPRNSDTGPTDFDLVLACDCVYNEALIRPLVRTCAEACGLRPDSSSSSSHPSGRHVRPPTRCLIAQQLRHPDVFSTWLAEFNCLFHVWRVPERLLPEELWPSRGFVLHIGVLKEKVV